MSVCRFAQHQRGPQPARRLRQRLATGFVNSTSQRCATPSSQLYSTVEVACAGEQERVTLNHNHPQARSPRSSSRQTSSAAARRPTSQPRAASSQRCARRRPAAPSTQTRSCSPRSARRWPRLGCWCSRGWSRRRFGAAGWRRAATRSSGRCDTGALVHCYCTVASETLRRLTAAVVHGPVLFKRFVWLAAPCRRLRTGSHPSPPKLPQAFSDALPFPLNWIVPYSQRREMRRQLAGADGAAAYADAADAIASLADRLRASKGRFFFGDKPSSLDALAFGHLAFYLHSPVAAPVLRSKVR